MFDAEDYRDLAWEELSSLMAGYLNQDFPESYGTAWSAVRAFCVDETDGVVARAAQQVRLLLDRDIDDDRLPDVLDELGSDYLPTGDGWAHRDWLVALECFLLSVPAEDPEPPT